MEGVTLANNATGKRRALDFYPTPPDATHALMRFLKRYLKTPCTIWEPACGDGSMSNVLEQYGHSVISSDIQHTGYGEGEVDFLKNRKECDAIITNPPFKESAEFIQHALSITDTVVMLLKSQYWHAKKRYGLFCDHPPAYILALTWRPDFRGTGGSPTMEVLWNIWLPNNTDTRYQLLQRPNL